MSELKNLDAGKVSGLKNNHQSDLNLTNLDDQISSELFY